MNKLFWGMLLLTISSFNIWAQGNTQNSTREQEIKNEADRQMGKTNDPLTGRQRNRSNETLIPDTEILEKQKRKPVAAPRRKEKTVSSADLFRKGRKMISIPSKYYEKYKDFLSQKKAGLAKIYLYKDCEIKKIVTVEEAQRCADIPTIPGSGAYYSFLKEANYSIENYSVEQPSLTGWWDLSYLDNFFIVGNCCKQGIISNIGSIELENVTLNSLPVKFLINYQPKVTFESIQESNKKLLIGIKTNGYEYSRKVKANLDDTYILRTIEYEDNLNKMQTLRIKNDADILVAFKIIGQESNDSLILLWKILSKN